MSWASRTKSSYSQPSRDSTYYNSGMIQQHIERMKERPRDERVAIAGAIAIGVMAALFFGWAIFFLSTLGSSAAPILDTATTTRGT